MHAEGDVLYIIMLLSLKEDFFHARQLSLVGFETN